MCDLSSLRAQRVNSAEFEAEYTEEMVNLVASVSDCGLLHASSQILSNSYESFIYAARRRCENGLRALSSVKEETPGR